MLARNTFASHALSSLLLFGDLALTILLELHARELLLFFIAHTLFKLPTLALSLLLLLLHCLHVALEGIDAMLERLHVLLLLFNVGLLGEHDGAVKLGVTDRGPIHYTRSGDTLIQPRIIHRLVHFVVVCVGWSIRTLIEIAHG